MGSIKPEVKYVFNYEGATSEIEFGVDAIQGGRVAPDGSFLNYVGTGAAYATINAQLVFEEVTYEETSPNGNVQRNVELGFLLPDVNAYVLGSYRYFSGIDPASGNEPYFEEYISIRFFLPKI